jgi:hypothetical protein
VQLPGEIELFCRPAAIKKPLHKGDVTMNSSVRIIKRRMNHESKDSTPKSDEKTPQERRGEMTTVVKGWIAEWKQRRQAEERISFKLWQDAAAKQLS